MRFINSYPQKMAAFVGKALIRVAPRKKRKEKNK